MVLEEKQETFLKTLKRVACFVHITDDDIEMIDEVLYHRRYTSTQRPKLARLRTRWYGKRDNGKF